VGAQRSLGDACEAGAALLVPARTSRRRRSNDPQLLAIVSVRREAAYLSRLSGFGGGGGPTECGSHRRSFSA
jgi:hypothetical protein